MGIIDYEYGFIVFPFLPESLQWIRLSTFGLMVAVAFLLSSYLLHKEFKRLGYPQKLADNMIFLAVIGGILGAKIFYVLEVWEEWHSWEGFAERFFSGAGLTWYGGLIVATLFLYYYVCIKKKYPFWEMADVITPILAIGYGVGRLGCFFSGDGDYGIRCAVNLPAPFCMAFPWGAYPWEEIVDMYQDPNVVVYNTPLFTFLYHLGLFALFWKIRKKPMIPGMKFLSFIFLHSIYRFFSEFIRLNPKNVFGLSQAQFISLILVLLSLFFLFYRYTRYKNKESYA